MSAFLVQKAHIDGLILAASRVRRDCPLARSFRTHNDADEIGRMLWRENLLSVEARYPHRADPLEHDTIAAYRAPIFTLAKMPGALNVVAAIKAVQCFEYQSCEHDGWIASDAREWCRALRAELVNALPGYDNAPWALTDARALLNAPDSLAGAVQLF